MTHACNFVVLCFVNIQLPGLHKTRLRTFASLPRALSLNDARLQLTPGAFSC